MAPFRDYECIDILELSYVTRIRRVRKIWEYDSCTERTVQGNEFELVGQ